MPSQSQPLSLLQARRLLLAGQALLGDRPAGGLPGLIQQLGFVQMDSINVVGRAHHLILASRLETYAPAHFDALLEQERWLFENWTHDAAAIPVQWYAHWKVRFPLRRAEFLANAWWRERVGANVEPLLAQVLQRIRAEGPLRSADFDPVVKAGPSAWWGWKPQKAALEFLWHTGELAVTRRVNFHKVYDLAERVYPLPHALPAPDPEAHREWACWTALDRLGVATPRELAAFWKLLQPSEAAAWCAQARKQGRIQPVALAAEGGSTQPAFAVADWERRLRALPEPGERLELLCPFDPILRDRARALRLFGFDYRFEAFVPAAKRQFGYYVLPLLEGETLVGRLDPKFHRDRGVLEIKGLWWEKGIRATKARRARLDEALARFAKQLGAKTVNFA